MTQDQIRDVVSRWTEREDEGSGTESFISDDDESNSSHCEDDISSMKRLRETTDEEGERISSIVTDLLTRKYFAGTYEDQSIDEHSQRQQQQQQPASNHEKIARESEEISSFPVQDHPSSDNDGTLAAAWLCGDALLMLRVGDTQTRYRGWVEMTIRSATGRTRKLVRLSSRASVIDPDYPSSLWSAENCRTVSSSPSCSTTRPASTFRDDESRTNDDAEPNATTVESVSHPNPFNSPNEESDILAKAMALIERWDSTQEPPKEKPNESSQSLRNWTDLTTTTTTTATITRRNSQKSVSRSSDPSTLPLSNNDRQQRKFPEKVHRSHSVGDVPVNTPGSDKTMSVRQWLRSAFDECDSNDVETALEKSGFSPEKLGISNNDNFDISDTDTGVTFRETMQPLKVDSRFFRAVAILDRTGPVQTHKIALLHATTSRKIANRRELIERNDRIAADETRDTIQDDAVLGGTYGSPEFHAFSRRLGSLVLTRHLKYFSGGLDTSAHVADGEFALVWISGDDDDDDNDDEDDYSLPKREQPVAMTMVLFHSVPLMPEGINTRKRHVGNDCVHIVYVESGNDDPPETYENDTIGGVVSGQFGFVTIFVTSIPKTDSVRVTVRLKAGGDDDDDDNDNDDAVHSALCHLSGSRIVPTAGAARYVRRVAIRADLACRSIMEERIGLASNWEERLVQIREMKRYVEL